MSCSTSHTRTANAERYQVFVGWDRPIPEEYVGVAVIGME